MLQMLCAGWCQFVNAHTAVCRRDAPFGFDQLLFQQTLESWVERTLFDLKEIVGGPLDVLDEGVAVQRLALESSENHHLERAGKEVALFLFFHGHSRKDVEAMRYKA